MMNKKNQKGAITLIYIGLLAIIAVLMLSISYSRMLLALKRGTSLSDTLGANYKAESEINNILARVLEGYVDEDEFPLDITYTTPDGTKVELKGELEGNKQTFTVVATRTFAVSKIKAVRTSETAMADQKALIMLSLDCTPSMNEKDGRRTTRFEEEEKAVLNFLDKIAESENKDKISLGVTVFAYAGDWFRVDGQELRPDAGLTLAQIRSAIERGLGETKAGSDGCDGVYGATSIGSGFTFLNTYMGSVKESYRDTKFVQVLVSDGLPNSRIAYPACPVSVYCPAYYVQDCAAAHPESWGQCSSSHTNCTDLAKDFLSCSLADKNTTWKGAYKGDRDPDVDAYAVTVLASPPGDVVEIFDDYATGYYNVTNASQLTETLEEIFETIDSNLSSVTIERVIPEE